MKDEFEETQKEYYDATYQDVIPQKKTGRKKKGSKKNLLKTVSLALVFGLIAGVTFQGVNYGYHKFIYQESTSNNEVNRLGGSSSDEGSIVATNTKDTSSSDIALIVENTMPSIVSISTTVTQDISDFFGRVYQDKATGSGSGIIIGQNNKEVLIATNNHVVEGADTVTVTFDDDKTANATVKGTSASSDLAQ